MTAEASRRVNKRAANVFAYVKGLYNTTRMHSSLKWMSPREFQKQFDQKLRADKPQKKHLSEREQSEPPPPNPAFSHGYLLTACANHSLKC